jgi:uncharacterized membrane protein (DUF485 family)
MIGARDRGSEEGDGIISLVKETADGLGRLMADHIKLARVEMVADAKSYARGLTILIVAGLILLTGYGLAWIAVALALARVIGAPLAFGAVALLHLVAGGIGLAAATRRIKRTHLMDDTAAEVSRSVGALAAPFAAAARR